MRTERAMPAWVVDQRNEVRRRAERNEPAMVPHAGDPRCVCLDGLGLYRDVTECCGNVNLPATMWAEGGR